jgi:hypothetical protein
MAMLDSAREELGWLKVLFAVLAAIDVSLIAWVSQTYDTSKNALLFAAMAAAGVLTAYVIWINQVAYRKIRELKDL